MMSARTQSKVVTGTVDSSHEVRHDRQADRNYFLQNKEAFMEYAGSYVAIRDGKMVERASTRTQLNALLKARFGSDVYAFCPLVCEESFADVGDATYPA